MQPLDPLQPVAPPKPPQRKHGASRRKPEHGEAPVRDRQDEPLPEEPSAAELIEDEGYGRRPADDDGGHIDEYA